MAAVFALVFVPALASVLFMVGLVRGGLSFATFAASTVFVALATGMLIGLFRLARHWEEEEPTGG
jgi:hypothetical protein